MRDDYRQNPVTADELLANRNPALGSLLTAERTLSYLDILLAMLRFRERHELEPLHEDLLEALPATAEAALFNQDIRQLLEWRLITERIEKERLRGYRDTRRRKFRYRISEEAAAFVNWLESRRLDDLEPEDLDTRDLLSDMIGSLREAARIINKVSADTLDYESARGLFHRLARMGATTRRVARSLSEFDIRLLAFATGSYDIPRARQLIAELDRFIERFLRRVRTLSAEITPEIDRLSHPRLGSRWRAAAAIMTEESKLTGALMRSRAPDHRLALESMAEFYAPEGRLGQLSQRVSRSALMVWQRLHTHLRELERRATAAKTFACE